MGPALTAKVVAERYFSLTVFGMAQIAMDIEPLIHILRRDQNHHGLTHTYLGAAWLGFVTVLLARPICQKWLAIWNAAVSFLGLRWLSENPFISWRVALYSALAGTFSHVLIDSLIHADMNPFWPFVHGNAMLNAIPYRYVMFLCEGTWIAGAIGWLVVKWVKRFSCVNHKIGL
jgi:membrane-bound metal-dependent hydrolase YbcI (DUF457 family)